VKRVELVESADEYFDLVVKPDLKVLGPKLGKDLPRAQEALRGATLRADGSVAAGEFSFAPNEVIVERRPRPGFAVAGEAPYFGVVDTRRTAELEAEGLARELAHAVNNLRKEAGFEISDRIVLRYEGPVAEVVERFRSEIAAEVLADRVEPGVTDGAWSGKLNGVDARLQVERL
jgi:isoleucyl-tRNA synthetase